MTETTLASDEEKTSLWNVVKWYIVHGVDEVISVICVFFHMYMNY